MELSMETMLKMVSAWCLNSQSHLYLEATLKMLKREIAKAAFPCIQLLMLWWLTPLAPIQFVNLTTLLGEVKTKWTFGQLVTTWETKYILQISKYWTHTTTSLVHLKMVVFPGRPAAGYSQYLKSLNSVLGLLKMNFNWLLIGVNAAYIHPTSLAGASLVKKAVWFTPN